MTNEYLKRQIKALNQRLFELAKKMGTTSYEYNRAVGELHHFATKAGTELTLTTRNSKGAEITLYQLPNTVKMREYMKRYTKQGTNIGKKIMSAVPSMTRLRERAKENQQTLEEYDNERGRFADIAQEYYSLGGKSGEWTYNDIPEENDNSIIVDYLLEEHGLELSAIDIGVPANKRVKRTKSDVKQILNLLRGGKK